MLSNERRSLSLAERVDAVKRLEAQESQSSVAKCFGVHPSTISRIIKNKQQILTDWQNNSKPDRKRKRTGIADDVEEALLRWFSQARRLQVPVSGPHRRRSRGARGAQAPQSGGWGSTMHFGPPTLTPVDLN